MTTRNATQKRADRAFEIILSNSHDQLGSRDFDNCFEMGDSEWVVYELMELVHKYRKATGRDPLAQYPASHYVCPEQWQRTYEKNQQPELNLI